MFHRAIKKTSWLHLNWDTLYFSRSKMPIFTLYTTNISGIIIFLRKKMFSYIMSARK